MSDESNIAEHYRRYHRLARPCTTYGIFLLRVASVLLVSLAILLIVMYGISVSEQVKAFLSNHFLQLYVTVTCLICLLLHKVIFVSVIELYQHYAPERIRRKCVCMPSCSVYATMAIKKYNTVKAIRLILTRLSDCHGTVCFIDYP